MMSICCAVFLVASVQEETPSYFPLRNGDQWVYSSENGETIRVVKSKRLSSRQYRLQGFPFVRKGSTLYNTGNIVGVKEPSHAIGRMLFWFGAMEGSPYAYDDEATITVLKVDATLTNQGVNYKGCRGFTITYASGSGEGSVVEMWLAPGLGLIRWIEKTEVGTRGFNLVSGRINGHRFGPIKTSVLAAGKNLALPGVTKKQVTIIRSQATLDLLYGEFFSGYPIPKVDFSKRTVVAVLLPHSPTKRTLQVKTVRWDFPNNQALILLEERLPGPGPTPWMATSPYVVFTVEGHPSKFKPVWTTLIEAYEEPADAD